MVHTDKLLIEALKIAEKDLYSNFGNLGIYASPGRHKSYWARDSFITSLGACANKNFAVVKNNLNSFIKFQRKDGHVPARIEEISHALRAVGIVYRHKSPKALHKQSQPWASTVVDSNSWLIISAINYVKTSNDKKWFKDNIQNLILAADWIESIMKRNLIYEGYTANWSDHNLKKGYVIYNNILAWKAFADLGSVLEDKTKEHYVNLAGVLKQSILDNFWDGELGYFIDWIEENGKKHKYFYTDGNVLAIWFNFTDKQKGKRIYDYIDSHGLNKVPLPTGYPKLDKWNNIFNLIVFPYYRTCNTFTWWGCVSAVSRLNLDDRKGALQDLNKVAEKIVKYNTCHEVLTPKGEPVNLWFYKSAPQIAWTAGMYIYAFQILRKSGLIKN